MYILVRVRPHAGLHRVGLHRNAGLHPHAGLHRAGIQQWDCTVALYNTYAPIMHDMRASNGHSDNSGGLVIKLILSDIDGTILPYGEKQISPVMLQAIHEAQDAGLYFAPCTGRGQSWLHSIFREDTRAYATCVAANGQSVFLNGTLLRQAEFSVAELLPLLQACFGRVNTGVYCFIEGIPHILCGDRFVLAKSFDAYARGAVAHHYDGQRTLKALDADLAVLAGIDKVNVFTELDLAKTQELCNELQQALPQWDFDVPNPGLLNVMKKGWNKASGIDVLVEALGISLDEVMVFGDGGNDVAMLTHVRHSVAVAGAVPEASAAASWHTGRVEDDAVAHDIHALSQGKFPFSSSVC